MPSLVRIHIIAGSDSGGGAGIQADIKTVTCLGGFATTSITAITAQNTCEVTDIYPLPPELVKSQSEAVLKDIGADAIKTGMLFSREIITSVAELLNTPAYRDIPLVVDPVMVAKSGDPLLKPDAIDAMANHLFPRATLITPNLPEASLLTGKPVHTLDEMKQAGYALLDSGAKAVLVKGGHLEGNQLSNILVTPESTHLFTLEKINSPHTHGTGCTLASAIATFIAQGLSLKDAVDQVGAYVHKAISAAPGLGSGHGPLCHNYMLLDKV